MWNSLFPKMPRRSQARRGNAPRARKGAKRLRYLESLEPRRVLAARIIDVTTAADTIDAGDGVTSLREAIIQANAISLADQVTINLQSNSTYNIQRDTAQILSGSFVVTENHARDAEFGDFDVTRGMTINGRGSIIRGERLGRVFQVRGWDVEFNDMAILNGGGSFITQGAGMHISGGSQVALNGVRFFNNVTAASGDSRGGALYADINGGTVSVSGGWFDDNAARGSGSGTAYGGAIYFAGGRLDVFGTEFDGNNALGGDATAPGAGGGLAYGGAVHVANGEAIFNVSTFTGNKALAGDGSGNTSVGGTGGNAYGGAVTIMAGRLDAQSSTFAENRAEAGYGAGEFSPGGIGGMANGGRGGSAYGGAVFLGAGGLTMNLLESSLRNNTARAGQGGSGTLVGGQGGNARGGAVATEVITIGGSNSFSIRQTDFQLNTADAGAGGIADNGDGGNGGDAFGGALVATFGTLDVKDSPFLGNRAMAGDGGSVWEGPAGDGGHGFGGAAYLGGTVATSIRGVLQSNGIDDNTALGTMSSNQALGGSGGRKLYSAERRAGDDDAAGSGGEARGGAVAAEGSTLYVEKILYAGNGAFAGNGGAGNFNHDSHPDAVGTAGGNSGIARGGALFTQVDTRVIDSAFASNKAAGGRLDRTEADPSTVAQNQGIAGGVGGLSADRRGLNGGRGGSAYGGAVNAYGSADLEVTRGAFLDNQALGGAGGAGSFGLPGSDPEGTYTAGSGGRGGEAFGGAIRGDLTGGSITVSSSMLSGNLTLAGKGGSGGFGVGAETLRQYLDDDNNIPNTDGGDGGDGGNAGGAGMSVFNPAGFGITTLNLTDVTVLANSVAGGDGGFAASADGRGGNGGDGGDAVGGGLHLDGVSGGLESVTVEGNVVSSGWGADGGAGGKWFLPWTGGEAVYGNDGGDGGDAGDASGAGIALVRGSLPLSHSTVVNNLAYAGPGGDGGSGGNGDYGSGNGGDGGNAGSVRGGGVYLAPGASASFGAATVAHNQINTSIGGHAGLAGVVGSQTPVQYEPAPDTVLADGAMSVFMSGPASASINFNTVGTSLSVPSDLNYEQATFSTATIYAASYAAALPVFAGAELAAAVTASLAVIRVVETGGLFIDDAVEIGATTSFALVPGASSTIGATIGIFTGGASIVAVVSIMLTRALVEGGLTGDFEAAFYNTLGSPNQDETFRYDQRLQYGFIPNAEPEEGTPIDLPGANGAAGATGLAEGTGVWGTGSMSRTLVAENLANQRTRTIEERVITETPPGSSFPVTRTVYEEREQFEPLARADVQGDFFSDRTNLIGAINSGFPFDLFGTVEQPLDAQLDTATAMWGGKTPTLKPLPGSPARGALVLPGIDVSQNDFLWAGRRDIGAWGGVANRAPSADNAFFTVVEDGSITVPLGSDPDGDPLALVGDVPTAANGTVALNGDKLVYTPNANWFGTETLNYQVTDGEFTANVTATIEVLPVNDAPSPQPGLLTINEDEVTYVNLWDFVTDVDTPKELLQFVVINGFGTGVAELQPDGHTVQFTPRANYHGPLQLFEYDVTDPGDGAGPAHQNLAEAVFFNVLPVNDAPVNTLPSIQSVDEDAQLSIAGMGVADVDAGEGDGRLRVTLRVGHGTLSLAELTNLAFDEGDGADDQVMSFSGERDAINAALAELTYRPSSNFNGADRLEIISDDLGNFGAGGSLVDADLLDIIVNAVNDAPRIAVPGAQTGYEDVKLVLTGITVADLDAAEGAGEVQVTLGVAEGALTLSRIDGLTFVVGDGSADATMTFRGALADVNAALFGMYYLGGLNYSGSDTLTIQTNDLGNTGLGGPLTDSAAVGITLLSWQQQMQMLIRQVNTLKESGVLSPGQAKGLLSKLKVDRGGAYNVRAFRYAVESYVADGTLTPEQAEPLLTAGEILLLSMTNSDRDAARIAFTSASVRDWYKSTFSRVASNLSQLA